MSTKHDRNDTNKEKEWAKSFSLIDKAFVEEADPARDAKRPARRRWVGLIAACAAAVFLGLVLFIPYRTQVADVSAYRDSDYYAVIERLNQANAKTPTYRNNFGKLIVGAKSLFSGLGGVKGNDASSDAPMADGTNSISGDTGDYRETTDNQVTGIIEGDLCKRTDTRAYYLNHTTLRVYSLEGADSHLIGKLDLTDLAEGVEVGSHAPAQMYLSADGRRVTVVAERYYKEASGTARWVTTLFLLDVTDPAAIRLVNMVSVSGDHVTTRLAEDGKTLLLVTEETYYGRSFYDETSFLPTIDRHDGRGLTPLEADCILLPESEGSRTFAILTALDADTLTVQDAKAVLGGANTVYVTTDTVYLAWDDARTESDGVDRVRINTTGIAGIAYGDGKLSFRGSILLDGRLQNQYSLDEYDGILRVVTGTTETVLELAGLTGYEGWSSQGTVSRNADLYCIALSEEGWHIVGQVEKFAPNNEQPQSVRFDGQKAYVCTALVIELTDPVYFFDLSDPTHITWSDTGTIDGYSHSLIQLPDGNLLGLGFGDNYAVFKAEVYTQTADGVASLCSWTRQFVSFSEDYKAYFIDREAGYIGLLLYDYDYAADAEPLSYVLLRYDGQSLTVAAELPVPTPDALYAAVDQVRGFVADGWLYVLLGNSLTAHKIG